MRYFEKKIFCPDGSRENVPRAPLWLLTGLIKSLHFAFI